MSAIFGPTQSSNATILGVHQHAMPSMQNDGLVIGVPNPATAGAPRETRPDRSDSATRIARIE
jgi:hypothetical protein